MSKSSDAERSRRLGRLVARIYLRLGRDMAQREIYKISITPAQHAALINIEDSGSRISELAKRLYVTKQAASKTVQELELNGLVTRKPDPNDHRASIILYTQQGQRILDDTLSYFDELEETIIGEFGRREFKSMNRQLQALADFLDPDGF